MSGYYTTELSRQIAERKEAGLTLCGDNAVAPEAVDRALLRLAEKAHAERLQDLRDGTREAAERWRAGDSRRFVDQVLTRARVTAAEREDRDLRWRQIKLRIAMMDRGVSTPPRTPSTARTSATRTAAPFARSWELDDIHILRAADGHGDGRTVEAYAAVFNNPAEIKDQHGHYYETIASTAFDRALSEGIDKVGVFYHHALTMHGTPSDLGSVPIGSPVKIYTDGKGLRTVTRFNRTPLADAVLEAIRNGDIKGYSFRGRIFQSDPARMPKARAGVLPRILRTDMGLIEYGPTPTPAYPGARVLAVRNAQPSYDRTDAVRRLHELSAAVADLDRALSAL